MQEQLDSLKQQLETYREDLDLQKQKIADLKENVEKPPKKESSSPWQTTIIVAIISGAVTILSSVLQQYYTAKTERRKSEFTYINSALNHRNTDSILYFLKFYTDLNLIDCNPKIDKLVNSVSLSSAYISSYTYADSLKAKFKIDYPKKNQIIDSGRFEVRGTYKGMVSPSYKIWAFVLSGDIYYPMTDPVFFNKNNSWNCTINYSPSNTKVKLVIALADQNATKWLEKRFGEGDFRGFPLPTGFTVIDMVDFYSGKNRGLSKSSVNQIK